MLHKSWRITCTGSGQRINADARTEEVERRVDGSPRVHEDLGVFWIDGPTLVGEVCVGGKSRSACRTHIDSRIRLCVGVLTTRHVDSSL